MSDNDDNVIVLRPGQDATDDARPLHTRPRTKYCGHAATELDRQARRVYCQACGEEVPAFDALLRLAESWEHFIAGRQEAERRMKVVRRELADLERQERNAKSRRARRVKQVVESESAVVAALRELLAAVEAGDEIPQAAAAEVIMRARYRLRVYDNEVKGTA